MLDKTTPYGEVFGIQGVRFEQGGRLFSMQGMEMRRLDTEEELYGPAEVSAEPVADDTDSGSDDFRLMHWRRLKALIEAYGGEWTNKEEAIAFLSGRV